MTGHRAGRCPERSGGAARHRRAGNHQTSTGSAVVERKLAVVGIDVDDALAEAQLDLVVGVGLVPWTDTASRSPCTAQLSLESGGRWYRTFGFGADEHYPAVEAFLAQRLRRLGGGRERGGWDLCL